MSFFRLCIYICLGLILMSVMISFVGSTGAFKNTVVTGGKQVDDPNNVIYAITGLDHNMDWIWLAFTSLAGVGAVVLAIAIGSFTPIAIYLFSEIFWTSYIKAQSLLFGLGGLSSYTPEIVGFFMVIHVLVVFVFIAGCIGMVSTGD